MGVFQNNSLSLLLFHSVMTETQRMQVEGKNVFMHTIQSPGTNNLNKWAKGNFSLNKRETMSTVLSLFRRSWVQISSWRLAILTGFLRVSSVPPSKC